MGKIYTEQTDLTIQLETGKDLTGITNVSIAWRNPQNEEGLFSATVLDPLKGIISYSIAEPLQKAGLWIVWAKIIDGQGLISIGEASQFNVLKKGN